MRKRSEREGWYFIYTCAYVYEPQHKTNGRERVKEQILRNKRVGQSESNGEEIRWSGRQSDKKSTNKRRELENDFTRV